MEAIPLQKLFSFDITPYARAVDYPGGGEIFAEWQPITRLVYLLEGRAKCAMSQENGTMTVLDFAQGPCFLGELELLGLQERAISVMAVTPCRGWSIDWTACREAILSDPVFLRALCIGSNEKAIRVAATAARNQSYPLKNRLATFVLTTQRQGVYREPHTQAAAYLGVSYRHLLAVLADFVRAGFLEKTPAGYRLADPAALEALAIPTWSLG